VDPDSVLKAAANRTNKDRNRATEDHIGARTKTHFKTERKSWEKTKYYRLSKCLSFMSRLQTPFSSVLFLQGLRLHQLIWDEFEPTWRNTFLCFFFVLG
jgi:hypothetical protein